MCAAANLYWAQTGWLSYFMSCHCYGEVFLYVCRWWEAHICLVFCWYSWILSRYKIWSLNFHSCSPPPFWVFVMRSRRYEWSCKYILSCHLAKHCCLSLCFSFRLRDVFLGVLYVKVLLWKILARLSAYVPLTWYSFVMEPQYLSKITNFRSSMVRLRSPRLLSSIRWRGYCLCRKRSENETERSSLYSSEFWREGLLSSSLFVSVAWC